MSERLLPEAICGAWFLYPDGVDAANEWELGTCDLYMFRVDGTFTRWGRRKGHVRETERGEYTFDGDFLITRGRNTETYRVDVRSRDHWALEDKKRTVFLSRAIEANTTIDEQAARDLRILPIRMGFEPLLEGTTDEVLVATYAKDGHTHRLGLVSVERRFSTLWVGVRELSEGLERATWARAVSDGLASTKGERYEGARDAEVEFVTDGAIEKAELG